MRVIQRTHPFKKNVKRMEKRGKTFETFKQVIIWLALGEKLPERFRDHELIGQYRGSRKCHIESDWLLIYELTPNELILTCTGSHSDLFRA